MNLDRVQVTAGTVTGTNHTLPGKPVWKNNQDAFCLLDDPEGNCKVGVIADGCSRGNHSVIGAYLGARVAARLVALEVRRERAWFGRSEPMDALSWGRVQRAIVKDLVSVVEVASEGEMKTIIAEGFLFALIGFVMTPTWTAIFRIGDGMDAVNGETRITPRYETPGRPDLENAPPYIMYAFTGSPVTDNNPKLLDFDVRCFETDAIRTLLIASDGGEDLVAAEAEPFPGTTEHVGPLSQVFGDEFFDNPDNLRRFLARANRETVDNGHIRCGLLPDDTTIIAVRVTAPNGETT